MSQSRNTKEINHALGIARHPVPFMNSDNTFTQNSIATGLKRNGGELADIKAAFIFAFNKYHVDSCPGFEGHFEPEGEHGYSKNLHLGTTRIWTSKGIDETRWQKLVNYIAEQQGLSEANILRKSTLHQYLNLCAKEDPIEKDTGRQTFGLFGSVSKELQCSAASKGWDEAFALLTDGWKPLKENSNEMEPYINLNRVRAFFEDTEKCLEDARREHLPVPKPSDDLRSSPRM